MEDRRLFLSMATATMGSAILGGSSAARAGIKASVRTAEKAQELSHPFGVQHIYYQGATNDLQVFEGGSLRLRSGMEPHPPHKHPEEEILLVAEGSGEIYVEGETTEVQAGAMMYTNANELHGIKNTGSQDLVFYYFKWLKS